MSRAISHKGHACLNSVFEVDISVEIVGRPEVNQLDGFVHAPDSVDSPKSLDDANRVPVNVVVDQVVAVLKILTFGNAAFIAIKRSSSRV